MRNKLNMLYYKCWKSSDYLLKSLGSKNSCFTVQFFELSLEWNYTKIKKPLCFIAQKPFTFYRELFFSNYVGLSFSREKVKVRVREREREREIFFIELLSSLFWQFSTPRNCSFFISYYVGSG